MAAQRIFVIVGAGLAGAKAAESLRAWGFADRVVLIGDEQVRPYQRPPLSKSYLRGKSSFEDAAVHSTTFYKENDIDLLTGETVTGVDLARKQIALKSGAPVRYDRLLLATGAGPRLLDAPGALLDGVFALRTVADADALRRATATASRAVVIGTGWVGTEVAASLRRSGIEVALVGRSLVPLGTALGAKVGRVFGDLHEAHGVKLHMGVKVISLHGRTSVEEVLLSDGTVIQCDLVVAGLGVIPRTELATAAGLAVTGGILADEHLETSATGVFVAGDVASAFHPVFGMRVQSEHWWAALTQGPTAAANMLGHRAVYDWIPTFTSKQYDLTVEHTGHASGCDRVVVRGSLASRAFVAFWLKGGRVLAGLNANTPGVARYVKALVAEHRRVDPKLLADPHEHLAQVAAATARSGSVH